MSHRAVCYILGTVALSAAALLPLATVSAEEPSGLSPASFIAGSPGPEAGVSGLSTRSGPDKTWVRPPYASWQPLFGHAIRNGVVVTPDRRIADRVVLENRNTFPVMVSDLEVLHRRDGGWVRYVMARDDSARLGAGGNVRVKLKRSAVPVSADESRARVRMATSVPIGLLELEASWMDASTPAASALKLARAVDGAARLAERENALLAAASGSTPATEEVQSNFQLADDVYKLACQKLSTALVDGGIEPIRLAREADGMVWMGRRGGLQTCLDEAAYAALVRGAIDRRDLVFAERLARRTSDSQQHTTPYNAAIVGLAEIRFAANRHTEPVTALANLQTVADFAPDHPLLMQRASTRTDAANAIVGKGADYNFVDATIALDVLSRERAASAEAAAFYDQTVSRLAYERGKFLYRHRRQSPSAMADAHASFSQAMAHAPVRSLLFRGGLVFVEHQFSSIFLIVLAIGLIAAVRGTSLVERVRLRRWLAAATRHANAGRHHEAREAFWRALTRTMGDTSSSTHALGTLATAAAGVMSAARQLGDHHEMAEAAGLLARVKADDRPASWRTPGALLADCGQHVDIERDDGRLAETTELLMALFPSSAMQALCTGLTHDLMARGQDASRSYHEAMAAYAAASHDADASELLSRAARTRAALLASAVGPRHHNPQEVWQQVFETWSSVPPVFADARAVTESRVLAASAAAPLVEAIDLLEQNAALLESDAAGRRLFEGSLLTAARGASLPDSTVMETGGEALTCQLDAFARLDNLLSAYVDGERSLDARLRVAVLRRLALTRGSASTDLDDYDADVAELLTAAQASRCPTTMGLASVLDLLTPGDWGFDEAAERAVGGDRALYKLLVALDHASSGRMIEAASALADADPDAGDVPSRRAIRMYLARADVSVALGQITAAAQALRKAHDTMQATDDRDDLRLIQTHLARYVAAGLLPLNESDRQLFADAVAGFQTLPECRMPWPWHVVANRLAEMGFESEAVAAIETSRTRDAANAAADSGRRAAFMKLCAKALSGYNYVDASRYARLGAESPDDRSLQLPESHA